MVESILTPFFFSSQSAKDGSVRIGDWTLQTSSSGKKYYYNIRTSTSQWEKPQEWLDYENGRDRTRPNDRDRRGEWSISNSQTLRTFGVIAVFSFTAPNFEV
jgi:hypothetical protein